MRDKLIHEYTGVDLWAVWGVVENIIPEFDNQIKGSNQERTKYPVILRVSVIFWIIFNR